MFIVEAFPDGSATLGFEPGDQLPLEEDFYHFNDRKPSATKGTMVTIVEKDDELAGDWRRTRYRVNIPNYGNVIIPKWYLDDSRVNLADCKLSPPMVFVVPWHEGKLWKYTKVVAYTAEEALEKMQARINSYGDPKRIHGVTFRTPMEISSFVPTGNECWMGSIR